MRFTLNERLAKELTRFSDATVATRFLYVIMKESGCTPDLETCRTIVRKVRAKVTFVADKAVDWYTGEMVGEDVETRGWLLVTDREKEWVA